MKKCLVLIALLAVWSGSVFADHTLALDLSNVKKNNVTYSTETQVATYTTSWGGVYWDAPAYVQTYTTATLVVDVANTDMDINITVRYTEVGASSTTDVNAKIAQGETTASVEIPAAGTINSIRVANRGKAGNVKIVSVTLSGLREQYPLSLTTMGAGWTSSYDASTQTITFGPGDKPLQTWLARGWSVNTDALNDYQTVVVEFDKVEYDVILEVDYTNTSDADAYARTTVGAGSKRASVRIPSDIKTLKTIYLKNSSNPSAAETQTLTLSNAYLTSIAIDYFDLTKATNTWSSDKSSYDASSYTITWTSPTRHGWYINAGSYNEYKSIVVEFEPAPVAITGYLRYKATSEASLTDVEYTIPAGVTRLTLAVPTTVHTISAIHLQPASACSLVLTDAYATMQEYEHTKSITLSSNETVVADAWASAGIFLSKEALALATAGDTIAVNVIAKSGTDASPCVALQNGSYGSFAGLDAYSLSALSPSGASPVRATFVLTDAILATVRGETDGVNEGLVVKGSGFTFNKVELVHYVYDIKGQPATNLWSGSEVISWNPAPANNSVSLPASAFALAESGMKLRMSFSNLKLSAQGRIVQGNWSAFTDADSYETLKTNWGNYYEFTLTSTMVTELQTNGLIVSGVGYTLTSIDLIDPECEYDVLATYDESDIRAWELSDGTPNLSVTLQNFESIEVTVPVNISLMTDMFVDYNTYSQNVTLAAGESRTIDVEFGDLAPGFYRMAANANGNKLCTYYIGYNPTAIVSPYDAQPDFWSFWNGWLDQLALIPIDAELTLLEGQEGDARNIYEVKYKSVPETVGGEPVFIYGYYAEPKAEGTYPCIIHFHGTDKSGVLTKPSATETGWCEFRFSARGQTLDKAKNGSVKYRTDPEDESSVDFYAYRLGNNDEHYYRYVCLDTRRAVDFVASRAKVNAKNIFAVGGSQGGCLTYVCAALSEGKVRAIAPSITGHADFVHTMEIVGWPTNVFNNWINAKVADGTYATYEAGKAALLQHQSYFDTKNFAPYITCPVITNFSLQDNTDGPHLNIAPYNLLNVADKQYSINPFKGHATANDWGTTYMNFFNARLYEEPLVPTALLNVSAAGMATYLLPFAVPTLPAGVEAYKLTNSGEETITAERVYALEEDKPVLIVADQGVYTFEGEARGSDDVSAKTSTYPNGALIGTYKTIVPLAQNDGAGNYNYVLNNGPDAVAFYQVLDGSCSVAPYRAYLSCSYNANASGPGMAPKKSMRIVFHQDSTTDMGTITDNHSPLTVTKVLHNGQLFILRDDKIYNAMGQIVK